MRAFTSERPADMAAALVAIGKPGAKFLGGGTNLLDLMKVEAETPQHLVDVSRRPLAEISEENGGLRIGATVTNSDLAADSRVRERYPVLSRALLNGASGQLRNQATTSIIIQTLQPPMLITASPLLRMASANIQALSGSLEN